MLQRFFPAYRVGCAELQSYLANLGVFSPFRHQELASTVPHTIAAMPCWCVTWTWTSWCLPLEFTASFCMLFALSTYNTELIYSWSLARVPHSLIPLSQCFHLAWASCNTWFVLYKSCLGQGEHLVIHKNMTWYRIQHMYIL